MVKKNNDKFGVEFASGCEAVNRDTDFLFLDTLAAGMLNFVHEMLEPVNSLSKSGRHFPFRSRYAHTLRVLGWVYRIAASCGGDIGILTISTIFHDVGYCVVGEGHALRSADIFQSYYESGRFDNVMPDFVCGKNDGLSEPFGGVTGVALAIRRALTSVESVERIRKIIAEHSAKHLSNEELPLESQILMDSDMLDESGAMDVLADCFLESAALSYDYDSAFDRICDSYEKSSKDMIHFHTNEGLSLYLSMRQSIGQFIESLKKELTR